MTTPVSPPAPLDVVKEFVRRFVAQDVDGALELLHDDIVVEENDHLPYPGDHVGKEAFVRLATQLRATWDFRGRPDLRFVGDADRAVVLVENAAVARATGRPITIRMAEVYTVTDGRIARVEMFYWDTVAVLDALAP